MKAKLKFLDQRFSIGGCKKGLLGVRTSLLYKKLYIKWCKGCENDFSFRTGCRLQNELRTGGLDEETLTVQYRKWQALDRRRFIARKKCVLKFTET